jgi:precorrin-6B methylase 2
MLVDEIRVNALERAIRASIRPGDVAIDLGSGTGLLSMMALRAGASRVYAIEESEAIEVAADVLSGNGMADRVTLLRGRSEAIELPERADVLIGYVSLADGIMSSFLDVRERLLKPDARMIPRRMQLVGALVTAHEQHESVIRSWSEAHCGFDFSTIGECASQQSYTAQTHLESVRSSYAPVLDIDFASLRTPFAKGSARLSVETDGMVHGLAAWMRAEHCPADWLSQVPPDNVPSWGNLLFPLPEPLSVKKGDFADVSVTSYDGRVWRWQLAFSSADGREVAVDSSTFSGFPFSPSKARSSHTPRELTSLGRSAAYALERLADPTVGRAEIAAALFQRFSVILPTPDAAHLLIDELDREDRR